MVTSPPTPLIEPARALGHRFPPARAAYDERDLALFALATGAGAKLGEDPRALARVYEGEPGFGALPGFGTVHALNALLVAMRTSGPAPGLHYGLERVLHAEQSTEELAPLPPRGVLIHQGRVEALVDKGRHALVSMAVESRLEGGDVVARHLITSLVRGGGGFGGEGKEERREERADAFPKERAAERSAEQTVRPDQAALYRLLGDDNPIHIDPRAARAFGLRAPILHGLSTLAMALRHTGDLFERRVASFTVRFSDIVTPGETLLFEVAADGDGALFRARVKERDRLALSHGTVRFAS